MGRPTTKEKKKSLNPPLLLLPLFIFILFRSLTHHHVALYPPSVERGGEGQELESLQVTQVLPSQVRAHNFTVTSPVPFFFL